MIELVLLSLFTGGNSLIVGVPGLAKTLLINTMAQVLDLKFSRIQFTPDLMPSDITGTDIIQDDPDTGRRHMVFTPGPIFANIVLADEINRTPPKTQSALLEAMQEHRVTVQGKTLQARGAVPRLRHAEPDRARGHVSAARSAARPVHVQHHHGLPAGRRRGAGRDVDDVGAESPLPARRHRRRHRRVPAARAPRADRRAGGALRGEPRAHEPARAQGARLHQAVGVVRRQHARAAASHPRRQGARAHGRALQRELRRHPRAREAGAAPSRADELPRASRSR